MKLRLFGEAARPCLTTLGTWDPFTADAFQFASILRVHATKKGLSAVPVIPDPVPAALLNGETRWAVYHDIASRVQMLLDLGMDAVGVLDFTVADLSGTACDFFSAIAAELQPREFWLRAGQSIGSGNKGNTYAVKAECTRRDCRLRVMPDLNRAVAVEARRQIGTGSIAGARAATGVAPVVRRPENGRVRLAWPVGVYEAVPRSSPRSDAAAEPLRLQFGVDRTGMPGFEWPDPAVEFLAFTAGPAELGAQPARKSGAAQRPVAVAV